jgi:hypothetical protein
VYAAAPAFGVKPAVLQNRFYADSGYDVELRAFCRANGVVYQVGPDCLLIVYRCTRRWGLTVCS